MPPIWASPENERCSVKKPLLRVIPRKTRYTAAWHSRAIPAGRSIGTVTTSAETRASGTQDRQAGCSSSQADWRSCSPGVSGLPAFARIAGPRPQLR